MLSVVMLRDMIYILLCWMSCWRSVCWVSLCWMLLCWVSLGWVSLCWVSLCWMSWHRRSFRLKHFKFFSHHTFQNLSEVLYPNSIDHFIGWKASNLMNQLYRFNYFFLLYFIFSLRIINLECFVFNFYLVPFTYETIIDFSIKILLWKCID